MSATFSRAKVKLNKADKVYYMMTVFLLLFSILAYTYPSIHMVHRVYMEQNFKADIRRNLEEQNRLRIEYEMILSFEDMEKIARAMGFVEPARNQIIYVMKR